MIESVNEIIEISICITDIYNTIFGWILNNKYV